MCVCVSVTYMSILIKKVQSIQIYGQDARGMDGGGATALDVEEGGAEHGEGTDQTWGKNTQRVIFVYGSIFKSQLFSRKVVT